VSGHNAALVAAEDVRGLRGAMAALLIDARLRRRLGDAARRSMRRWSWRECVAETLRCLLDESPVGGAGKDEGAV
jgi:hypothetical protein